MWVQTLFACAGGHEENTLDSFALLWNNAALNATNLLFFWWAPASAVLRTPSGLACTFEKCLMHPAHVHTCHALCA